jgi:NAD(P)-dependent dehydrogenase (short-subunit alcohol dehydrogenase family)
MDLEDRVFIIAGAAGGLGAPISRMLAEAGARLVVTGRHRDRLDSIGVDAVAIAADLRMPDHAGMVVTAATSAYGRLDGVVNATGVVAFGPAISTGSDVVEELFLTNTFLPMFLFGAAIPAMAHGGVLVTISGVVASQPQMGMAAYSASKAATAAYAQALRRELRPTGIRVLDAHPGHTETALSRHPIAGTAPRFPTGMSPDHVAGRIVAAIVAEESHLGPDAFA